MSNQSVRCSACRWWMEDKFTLAPAPQRECRNEKFLHESGGASAGDSAKSLTYQHYEGGQIWTGPDFGCVHFEPIISEPLRTEKEGRMSDPIEDGGAAFPVAGFGEVIHGMSIRTYAAIKLRVPESGIDWLDDMIRKSESERGGAHAESSATGTGTGHLQPQRSAFDSGVWFQSASSGLWYQGKNAGGNISAVKIDGVFYARRTALHESDKTDGKHQDDRCGKQTSEIVRCPDDGGLK